MIRDDILEELKQIPEAKLAEVYDLIHYFRLGLQSEQRTNPSLELAGAWRDMPDDVFRSFLEETTMRRREGFSKRRAHAPDVT